MMKLMILSILQIFHYVLFAPVSNSKKRVRKIKDEKKSKVQNETIDVAKL